MHCKTPAGDPPADLIAGAEATVAHPITGEAYPLILDASAAARSVGMNRRALVKLAEAGQIDAVPHAPLAPWRIFTLPLWRRFGLMDAVAS